MRNIFAFTRPTLNPPYISVNETRPGVIAITVRGELPPQSAKKHVPAPVATIELSTFEYHHFLDQQDLHRQK